MRVVLLCVGVLVTVFVTGALMLTLFDDVPISGSHHRSPSAALEIVIGVLLLLLALRLHRRGRKARPATQEGGSKVDGYLQSRPRAAALGFVLYVVPSPIYIAAVKAIADAHNSTSVDLGQLLLVVVVMCWIVEIPTLMLLAMPGPSQATLEAVNMWLARNGRVLALVAALAAGIYLICAGVVKLAE